jgi:hypothetical protein
LQAKAEFLMAGPGVYFSGRPAWMNAGRASYYIRASGHAKAVTYNKRLKMKRDT